MSHLFCSQSFMAGPCFCGTTAINLCQAEFAAGALIDLSGVL